MTPIRRQRSLTWAASLLFLAEPAAAEAHNVLPGMNEFVNGFVHPLATPSHLIAMIGLGLLVGQRQPLRLRIPAGVFAAVLALALMATTRFSETEPRSALALVPLTAGLLVVSAVSLRGPILAAVFALAALALGLDSVADGVATPWAVVKTLLGTWLCFLIGIVDVAYYVSLLPTKKAAQIGIRVAGSWIVAISFLVLAFALKSH